VTPGDVTNREFVENAAQSTEAIVHLAGIIREFPARGVTFERVHGEATQHAVHAAKMWGISRFVHVSALGASPHGPGNYFSSKGKAEEIVRQSGLSWTIFRPSGIVGPGDQFLTELGRAVRRAPFLPIPGDGEFLLQPVFVGDVVKGITDCLKRPDTEKREFEVGGPERITYNALIDRIAAAQGVRVRKVHIPLPRFPSPGSRNFLSHRTCSKFSWRETRVKGTRSFPPSASTRSPSPFPWNPCGRRALPKGKVPRRRVPT
jgi:NADH dehydrogenase